MRKRISCIALSAVVITVAACGDSPPTAVPDSSDARFDGGWTIGSGGRSDTTTTTSTNSDVTVTCAGEGEDDAGGWTIGSGGLLIPPSQCGDQ